MIASQAKEEQDLVAILREINYGVFVEKDPGRIETLLHQQSFHLAILFERAVSDQLAATKAWLARMRQGRIPVLWVVSPSFDPEAQLVQATDQKLLWPMDIDIVIDAVETAIGLPAPMEEHTLRISEDEASQMIAQRQQKKVETAEPKLDDLTKKIAELEKQNQDLYKTNQKVSDELRTVYNELQKEKELNSKLKQVLSSASELMKK